MTETFKNNNGEDYYGSYKRLDYYTNYYNDNKEEKEEEPVSPVILEEKDGWIKIWNGHVGTFVWERVEEDERDS